MLEDTPGRRECPFVYQMINGIFSPLLIVRPTLQRFFAIQRLRSDSLANGKCFYKFDFLFFHRLTPIRSISMDHDTRKMLDLVPKSSMQTETKQRKDLI